MGKRGKYLVCQCGLFVFLSCILFISCGSKKEEMPIIPPVTSPLSGDYIGFGVITASYTHLMAQPEENAASAGYLRRGTIVEIVRRISGASGDWVFVGVSPGGWLREDVMEIYDSEVKAKTAAQLISR
jgi:hypothetical protein